ncbi:T9SS type A sorting domain-containing protein, partial [Spirosoma koreense]
RGTSYYRLRQVDQDGRSETFRSASVVIDARYGVYPNPVVGSRFSVELDEPSSAVLHLYTASGSELSLQRESVGEQRVELNAGGKLTGGVYLLSVEERGTVRKHRIVVQ